VTETPDTPGEGKPRQRPTHWRSPVDERRRLVRAKRHGRRRIFLLILVLLVATGVGLYWHFTSDAKVQGYAEQYLTQMFGTGVKIGHATFNFRDGLVLDKFRLMAPAPFDEPLLVADRVTLVIDPTSLLSLKPDVTEIVVRRPEINLVLWDEKIWNFQALIQQKPAGPAPRLRPVFTIDDGSVHIKRKIAGETVYEQRVRMSGLLLPSENDPHMFRFQTEVSTHFQTAPGAKNAPAEPSKDVHLTVASGLLDGRTGSLSLEGQASNVQLTPELYASLPREAQRVWDRFNPTGSMNLKVLFDDKQGLQLLAELTGVQFTCTWEFEDKAFAYIDLLRAPLALLSRTTGLPAPWVLCKPSNEFTGMTGRCLFTPSSLTLERIQGLLNGSPLRLGGKVTGFDAPTLAMDLDVAAENINLAEMRPMLVNLAPHMAALYDIYSPAGQVDVAVQITREGTSESGYKAVGSMELRGVDMRYDQFQYRLERVKGRVQFDPEGFRIEGLDGHHGQADVHFEGWVKNPGPQWVADVTIRGKNVPLDEDLRAALAPVQRDVYDQYTPAGTTDLDVHLTRDPKLTPGPRVTVDMKMHDCQVKYKEFPYQLTQTRGQVLIEPERTRIVDVEGRHGDAVVTIAGDIEYQGADPPKVNLKVAGRDVAIDDDLKNALAERERATVQVFHLGGRADFDGTVVRGAGKDAPLDYDLGIRLKGARLIHEDFPYLAEDVTGRMQLANGRCRIDGLQGRNGGASISARGWIDQRADDFAMDIQLEGQDVALDESLRGALGPDLRAAWRRLSPSGHIDITAHLVKALGRDEKLAHEVHVVPRDIAVTLDMFPYPLEGLSGRLDFVGSEVRLSDLHAHNGPAEFFIGGRIGEGPHGPEADLTLKATSLRLEGPVRRAVPASLRELFEKFDASGRMDLDGVVVKYRPTGPDTFESVWKGSAVMDEVGLSPGIHVSGVVGTADMNGRWTEKTMGFHGNLWVQQGKVAEKTVSNLRVILDKPETAEVLSSRTVEGEFYGGLVEGTVAVSLGPGGQFGFQLTVHDVDFEKLMHEGFHLEQGVSGGQMRATLNIAGKGPQADAVQASGYAEITKAKLYELPPILRALGALRMAPAEQAAFQEAHITYFLRGKRLILEDVRLLGRALDLYGAGVIEPDGQVHLTFMTGKKDEHPLIPALSELAEGVRKEIVVVEVTGPMSEPKVEAKSLQGLTAPLRELMALVKKSQETRERRNAAPARQTRKP
jgi:hypothetical protein